MDLVARGLLTEAQLELAEREWQQNGSGGSFWHTLFRLGFLSAGGWDTHANQGNTTGILAKNLGDLATTLVQLRRDFSQAGDVVMEAFHPLPCPRSCVWTLPKC